MEQWLQPLLKGSTVITRVLKKTPDIKVIAYGLEDNPIQWENTIANLPAFTHVYGEKKWDNPIVEDYNLTATPTYFMLDRKNGLLKSLMTTRP